MTDQVPQAPAELTPDALLSRQELVAQLPRMGMTESLGLVAVEPDGSEHPANVGYSSDLKAFALMEYDTHGNITSWYPLPTRTTNYHKGFGATSELRYADWAVPTTDRKREAGQTLFRIAIK